MLDKIIDRTDRRLLRAPGDDDSAVFGINRKVLLADLSDGTVRIDVPKQQKNSALTSTAGCDVMAVIPAGSGPLPAGTVLKGYLMN